MRSGWTTLEWSTRIPTNAMRPGLWYDNSHPRARLSEDLIVGWVRMIQRRNPNTMSVLLIGDSSIAYCFDRYTCVTRKELRDNVMRRTGVDVWLGAVSGSSFTWSYWSNFKQQVVNATKPNHRFDAVLLVGGWNQVTDKRGFTAETFAQFHAHSKGALW